MPRPCLGKEDLFFPRRTETDKIVKAMSLCLDCEFRNQCEEYREVSGSEFGIWGGKMYPLAEQGEEADGA